MYYVLSFCTEGYYSGSKVEKCFKVDEQVEIEKAQTLIAQHFKENPTEYEEIYHSMWLYLFGALLSGTRNKYFSLETFFTLSEPWPNHIVEKIKSKEWNEKSFFRFLLRQRADDLRIILFQYYKQEDIDKATSVRLKIDAIPIVHHLSLAKEV